MEHEIETCLTRSGILVKVYDSEESAKQAIAEYGCEGIARLCRKCQKWHIRACLRSDGIPLRAYDSEESAKQSAVEFEKEYGCKAIAYLCEGKKCQKWHVKMGYTLTAECGCEGGSGTLKGVYISGVIARKVADARQKRNPGLILRVYNRCPKNYWHLTKQGGKDAPFDEDDIFGKIDVPDGIKFPSGIKIPQTLKVQAKPEVSEQKIYPPQTEQPKSTISQAASISSDKPKFVGEIDSDEIDLDDIDFGDVLKWGAIGTAAFWLARWNPKVAAVTTVVGGVYWLAKKLGKNNKDNPENK